MNENNEIEPQVSFKDFVLYLKKSWKSTFIIPLICSLLIGGCYVIKSYYAIKNDKSFDEEVKQYEESLDAYEDNIDSLTYAIEEKKNELEDMEKYIDNSVLMGLNADELLVTKTDITFMKEQIDFEEDKELAYDDVSAIYYNLLTDNADLNSVSELLKIDEEYIQELIDISSPSTGILRIKVIYPDKKYAKDITDLLLIDAQNKMDRLDLSYNYSYLLLSQSSKYEKDENLKNAINDKKNTYEILKGDYEGAVENLNNYSVPEYPEKTVVSRKRIFLKTALFTIAGFIFGLLIVVFVRGNSFIEKGIIYSEDEFSRILESKNLCVFDRENKKSGKNISCSFTGSDYDSAYDRVKIYFDNEENTTRKIMLVDNDAKRGNQIISMLEKIIEDKEFALCCDIKNNESLKTLFDSDGVIVVCEREKTVVNDLIEVKKFVNDNNSKIIGNIII